MRKTPLPTLLALLSILCFADAASARGGFGFHGGSIAGGGWHGGWAGSGWRGGWYGGVHPGWGWGNRWWRPGLGLGAAALAYGAYNYYPPYYDDYGDYGYSYYDCPLVNQYVWDGYAYRVAAVRSCAYGYGY